MKKQYILALSVLFFAACHDKEETIIPADTAVWEEEKNFTLDQRAQLNSYADGDQLLLLGLNSLHRMTDLSGTAIRANVPGLSNAATYKFPIVSNAIAVAATESIVFLYPTHYPNYNSRLPINLKQIDPFFEAFTFMPASEGESIKISGNNVCLIPYRAQGGQRVLRITYAIQKNTVRDNPDALSIVRTEIVDIPTFDAQRFLLFEEFNNRFYLSDDKNLWSIAESGEAIRLLQKPVAKMFKLKNELFTIAPDGFYSSTNGTSWNRIGFVSNNMTLVNYTTLNDTLLIGYRNDQLFRIKLEPGSKTVELANAGMEGHWITSVSLFKDRVYLTTLSGVFTKNLSDFIKLKEDR